jgi:hypothetical protein
VAEVDLNALIEQVRPVAVSGDIVGVSMMDDDGLRVDEQELELEDLVWERQTLDDVIATVIRTHQDTDAKLPSLGSSSSSSSSGARMRAEELACVVPNSSAPRTLSCLKEIYQQTSSKRYAVLFPATLTLVSALALRQRRTEVMPWDLPACTLIRDSQPSEWMAQDLLYKKGSKTFRSAWKPKLCMLGPASSQQRRDAWYSLQYCKPSDRGKGKAQQGTRRREMSLQSATARPIETSPKAKRTDLQSRFVVSGEQHQKELVLCGRTNRERDRWIDLVRFVASVMGHHGLSGASSMGNRKVHRKMSASHVVAMVPHSVATSLSNGSGSPASGWSSSSSSQAPSPSPPPHNPNPNHHQQQQHQQQGHDAVREASGSRAGRLVPTQHDLQREMGRREASNKGTERASSSRWQNRKKSVFKRGKSSARNWLLGSPHSPTAPSAAVGNTATLGHSDDSHSENVSFDSKPGSITSPPAKLGSNLDTSEVLTGNSSRSETTAAPGTHRSEYATRGGLNVRTESSLFESKALRAQGAAGEEEDVAQQHKQIETRAKAMNSDPGQEEVQPRAAARVVGSDNQSRVPSGHAADALEATAKRAEAMKALRELDPGKFSMGASFTPRVPPKQPVDDVAPTADEREVEDIVDDGDDDDGGGDEEDARDVLMADWMKPAGDSNEFIKRIARDVAGSGAETVPPKAQQSDATSVGGTAGGGTTHLGTARGETSKPDQVDMEHQFESDTSAPRQQAMVGDTEVDRLGAHSTLDGAVATPHESGRLASEVHGGDSGGGSSSTENVIRTAHSPAVEGDVASSAWLHDPQKLQQHLEELASVSSQLAADVQVDHRMATSNATRAADPGVGGVGASGGAPDDSSAVAVEVLDGEQESSDGSTPRSTLSRSTTPSIAEADPDDAAFDRELSTQPAFHQEAILHRKRRESATSNADDA